MSGRNGPERVLVVSPTPAFPTSAGNRRRVLSVCDEFERAGLTVDFAYYGLEDALYAADGKMAPTDHAAMAAAFATYFYIECRHRPRRSTRGEAFLLDDWAGDELEGFVRWYFDRTATTVALVNYVFLSRAFRSMPAGVFKILDTHDRFGGRRTIFDRQRLTPTFFHLTKDAEAKGLTRADLVLAIEPEEARHFADLAPTPVLDLPYRAPRAGRAIASDRVATIGFLGHGNEPNVVSIRQFAHAWSAAWQVGKLPTLQVAGEVCEGFRGISLPGVEFTGYATRLDDFYDRVDLVVAPMVMGTGQNIKVVEALSRGVPVVGTALAFRGLEARDPAHRFAGIPDMVTGLQTLVPDRRAVARLRAEGTRVYALFDARAEAQSHLFRDILQTPRPSRSPSHPLVATPPHDASPEVFLFDGGIVWSETGIVDGTSTHERTFTFGLGELVHAEGRLIAWRRQNEDCIGADYTATTRLWFLGTASPGGSAERADPAARRDWGDLADALAAGTLRAAPTFRDAVAGFPPADAGVTWLLHHLSAACGPWRARGTTSWPARSDRLVITTQVPAPLRRRPGSLWQLTLRDGERCERLCDPHIHPAPPGSFLPRTEAGQMLFVPGIIVARHPSWRPGHGAALGLWAEEEAGMITLG